MAYITNEVQGCFVTATIGSENSKWVLQKTSATDPFTEYSPNDVVRVYASDYSSSVDLIVLSESEELTAGGTWVLRLGDSLSPVYTGGIIDSDYLFYFVGVGVGSTPSFLPSGAHFPYDPLFVLSDAVGNYQTYQMAYWEVDGGGGIETSSVTAVEDIPTTVADARTLVSVFPGTTDITYSEVENKEALWDAFGTDTTGLVLGILNEESETGGGLVLDVYTENDSKTGLPIPSNGIVDLPRTGLKGREFYIKVRSATGLSITDSFSLNSAHVEYYRGGDRR